MAPYVDLTLANACAWPRVWFTFVRALAIAIARLRVHAAGAEYTPSLCMITYPQQS